MYNQETLKSDALRFVNTVVKAKKMLLKQYESLEEEHIFAIGCGGGWITDNNKEVHIAGLIKLANLIGVDVQEANWSGNDSCNTNHIEISFIYKGIKFFELVDKLDLIKAIDNIEFMEESSDERE